ncbi:glycosyltransferase family 2 protein [Candidatus Woesebacteria bacterium]|nr:glycosyltransferase family 2 protein [Candidatus Woesebacteria bacterium]
MDISVIILSYNTKDTTARCLKELNNLCTQCPSLAFQVIVVDNASTDGSVELLQSLSLSGCNLEVVYNVQNVGFSRGNNIGLQKARGKYVLYLNSDVMVGKTSEVIRFVDLISYMDSHLDVGALTVRVELPSGHIDPASHRGFPTPWRSLAYFLKFEKIIGALPFLNSSVKGLLGGYHLMGEDLNTVHQIDAGTAAFLFCRKESIDSLKGFDEAFFMYGEDLDLCYRLKELGQKVIWYPHYTVTHLKYQSGLQSNDSKTKQQIRWHFYDAMEKFYLKHYKKRYCVCVNTIIMSLIQLKKALV